jgi:hypothetical protein
MSSDPPAVRRLPPLLWRVRGLYAGLDWDPVEGLFTASVPSLPGPRGRGPDRTAALRALERELGEWLGSGPG